MKKDVLKQFCKIGGVIYGSILLFFPIGYVEASVITGPYNFTTDTIVTAPVDYTFDVGSSPSTYSIISASGASQAITADNNVKVTVINNNTDTGDGKKWVYGVAAFNGGTVSLNQVTIKGSAWAGLSAEGGNISVGDNLYIDTYQADGSYQSYGIRVDRYATTAASVTVGDNAYIRTTGDNVWVNNVNGSVTIGNYLTADATQVADASALTIFYGSAKIGDHATITSTGQGIFAYSNANVILGNNATIKTNYIGGTSYYGIIGILSWAGSHVSVGNNLTLTSDGYGLLSSGTGSDISVDDGAVLRSNMTYQNGLNMSVLLASKGGTISLKGATISMDNLASTATAIAASSGGKVSGIGVYDINGDIKAKTGGTIDLTMQSGSKFKGISQLLDADSVIDLSLSNSVWKATGTSSLTNLSSNNSTINMTADNNQYSTLTVNNLSGTGSTFILDVDGTKNVDNSDKIYVTDTFTGKQSLALNEINGRATDPTLGQDAVGTVLASVNNNQGTFVAADGEGTLYWKRYVLATEASTTSGYTTDWYLKAVDNMDPNDKPTTTISSIIRSGSSLYNMWRDNDQLMMRLGDLRKDGDAQAGVWVRMKGVKSARNGVYSLENEYKQYQIGYDKIIKKTKDYVRYGGLAFGYSDGDISYTDGSGKNKERSLAFYQTQVTNNGHYLDMVLKAGRLNGDFSSYDSYENNITGEHGANGVSLGVEYGRKKKMTKDGWYVEPQAQLTVGRIFTSNYTLNSGAQVYKENTDSALGRIGMQVGKDIDSKTNIYAKVNVLHEFGGNYKVKVTDGSSNLTVSDDLSSTWAEYGVGADIKMGKTSRIYFDVSKGLGGEFKKTWQWNLGARWSF
jgi:outer membrane autotransporter protein